MQICFRVPKDSITLSGARFICFNIPILIVPWWKQFRNPGDPVVVSTDGWITTELISAQNARDLSILASMHELTGQLSPEVQRTMEAPIAQAFKGIKLPEFATLSFDESAQQVYKQLDE